MSRRGCTHYASSPTPGISRWGGVAGATMCLSGTRPDALCLTASHCGRTYRLPGRDGHAGRLVNEQFFDTAYSLVLMGPSPL